MKISVFSVELPIQFLLEGPRHQLFHSNGLSDIGLCANLLQHMAQQENNYTLLICSHNAMRKNGKDDLAEAVKNEMYL